MNKQPYHLHSTTSPALEKMRAHRDSYETTVLGVPILVNPGVWSPAYDWSGLYYGENLPPVRGKDVLEVGCGSGVVSVFAARAGARKVLSVDINPAAVENTRQNFARLGLTSGEARISNMFSAVSEKFDVVIFNAPYHGCKPHDLLEWACSDEDYISLKSFFINVADHLNPGGLVSVGFSESGDLKLFHELVAQNRFKIVRSLSDWREGYNCMIFDLVLA